MTDATSAFCSQLGPSPPKEPSEEPGRDAASGEQGSAQGNGRGLWQGRSPNRPPARTWLSVNTRKSGKSGRGDLGRGAAAARTRVPVIDTHLDAGKLPMRLRDAGRQQGGEAGWARPRVPRPPLGRAGGGGPSREVSRLPVTHSGGSAAAGKAAATFLGLWGAGIGATREAPLGGLFPPRVVCAHTCASCGPCVCGECVVCVWSVRRVRGVSMVCSTRGLPTRMCGQRPPSLSVSRAGGVSHSLAT